MVKESVHYILSRILSDQQIPHRWTGNRITVAFNGPNTEALLRLLVRTEGTNRDFAQQMRKLVEKGDHQQAFVRLHHYFEEFLPYVSGIGAGGIELTYKFEGIRHILDFHRPSESRREEGKQQI